MPPEHPLPLHPSWKSEDEYVQSLLSFSTGSHIFRNLCGGIHVLDFLTREPDLYKTVLPHDWRDWFDVVDIYDILNVFLRDDLDRFSDSPEEQDTSPPPPPKTLLEYVRAIRRHGLVRDQTLQLTTEGKELPRNIAVGMKPKKIHEVSHFAAYVDKLAADIFPRPTDHVPSFSTVDFGSGRNYLGRTLASPPFNQHIIAIERHHHNIDGAKDMDVHAKLAQKEMILRNKKDYKMQLRTKALGLADQINPTQTDGESVHFNSASSIQEGCRLSAPQTVPGRGSMTYIEHNITDGNLETLLHHNSPRLSPDQPKYLIVSLHSCGNLVHHGLRSLMLNPTVSAVALVGCCYNLMTERLGPATYKLPQLRPNHPRLHATSTACDPHGFPLSQTLAEYPLLEEQGTGVRLNITARMMAVQAPHNWGRADSEAFFRRHFYRALLQRLLLDLGVVKQCNSPDSAGGSISGKDENGTPLIVGTLGKSCFTSFRAYVHGALAKLLQDPVDGAMISDRTCHVTDAIIDAYEEKWAYAKKNLSVIWSLMAFSAGVVESLIVVDRWLFLKEQDCVEKCWVEPVFDYTLSPRNLVVVGIKKQGLRVR